MTSLPSAAPGGLSVVGRGGHPAGAECCQRDDRHDLGSHAESTGQVLTLASGTLAVLAALAAVRDPELDEPITSLGFVTSCAVSADGLAEVRLRLPTYFCAPNFAFLMVADAYDAVAGLEGVRSTEVVLEDHFASDAINGGVAAQEGFARAFDGEAVGELHQLRADFLRKAVMAGTDQVCRPLVASGTRPEALAAMTLGECAASPGLDRLRQRRAELGLPAGDDAPLVIDPLTGSGVDVDALPLHLRRARVTGVSIQANASICRGMLRARYPKAGESPAPTEPRAPSQRQQWSNHAAPATAMDHSCSPATEENEEKPQ